MKIDFAITVCNEFDEIKRLVEFLLNHKRVEDNVVVLYDDKNGNPEIFDYLSTLNIDLHKDSFDNNFAGWKNKLSDLCKGDYIFQIDADEMISEYLVKNISTIIELNEDVDLIYVPRINIVNGITDEHVQKWGWNINEKNWINFPDFQGRVHKKGLKWEGNVHEKITGFKIYSVLPTDHEEFCIKHIKGISRQEEQNDFYNTLKK